MYRSFFFSDHCIKQIDSMLPWVCSVIDHRGRQNVVKTSVTHSPAARVPLLCFYHILTSSVIYITEQTYGNMEPICKIMYGAQSTAQARVHIGRFTNIKTYKKRFLEHY